MAEPLLPLRPYQRAAVEAVLREFATGKRRTLVVAPTGSGKTWIEGELAARTLTAGQRVLILAHREELVEQHTRLIREVVLPALDLRLGVGVEQAERRSLPLDAVVVGSVPTLGGARCRRWRTLGAFGLVVLDEAHHGAAETYQRALAQAGCWAPDGARLVGFTATPQRGDGVGLGHLFESIAMALDWATLMRQGYLCPLRAYTIDTGVALDRVRVRGGDWDADDLERAVNTPARNALAVQAYRAHAAGRPAIAFAVDRRHVHDLAAVFSGTGVRAAALTGDMPHEERRQRLEAFRRRAVDVLVNCAILTEGVDLPLASAAVLARPTRSALLLTQQIGRILRPDPASAKTDAVAIDLVDVCRAGLQTVASLVGLPPRVRWAGERVLEARDRVERALESAPWAAALLDADRLVGVEDVLAATREADLFLAELPMPREFERSRLAWVAVPPARWVLSCQTGTLIIRQTVLDYRVTWRPRQGRPEDLGGALELAAAIDAAERWARRALDPQALRMLDRRAPWRSRPASARQRAVLARFGIDCPADATAEQASRAIERRLRGLSPRELRTLLAPERRP